MIERKCLKCGHWNKAEDYCSNCSVALSPKAIDKEKAEALRKEEEARPPSKFKVFMDRCKNSKYFFVRWFYYLLYSITVIVGLFGAFMAWLAAMSNA